MKNEFTTLFLKYVLKGLFPFAILDARFEPTLTKNAFNISAMQFLFVITFPFTINEFGVVLSLDFNVTTDLMPSQVIPLITGICDINKNSTIEVKRRKRTSLLQ